jgi:glycosyltransferase involved in cell wall biosynthesis
MAKPEGYIPKEDRKKILLICDDIRVHSGVATVAKEIVIGTAHKFNWLNAGGAIKHPEKGKRFDLSESINELIGIEDSYVHVLPTDGYGNSQLVRDLIRSEKPDAIMLITDPRYFGHIFSIEQEIRKKIPIAYLNIWDDYPAPMYNRSYYEACDLLLGISKQTVNINRLVLSDKADKRLLRYVPHGLNESIYFPIDKNHPEYKDLQDFKSKLLNGKKSDFTLFFNSRNIRRKQIPDTLLAFRVFLDSLPYEKAQKCHLVLHTELKSDHGTDLQAVSDYFFDEKYQQNIIFSTSKLESKKLNYLYNSTDAQILITSNEGWGLTLTEAMLVGNPIIANVTGGMQDQMRFVDEKGEWFTPSTEIPSNHRGTFKKHGEWAFPVFPTSRSIQGSIPTPYIYDDRCKWEDVVDRIKELYEMDPKERKDRGLKGREWALSDEAGFTTKHQALRVIEAFDTLFKTWKPRESFEIINATKFKGRVLNHNLIY